MKPKYPMTEDFDSIEEYESAVKAYEEAMYWKEEEAMERYYEEKYNL